MSFVPVAGENVDLVLELPSGDLMGFLCQEGTALRRTRASDYAPIVASAGVETEATGTWRRWAQEEFSEGLGEEDWDTGGKVLYAEGLEFQESFVTLAGRWVLHSGWGGAIHHFCDFLGDIYMLQSTKVFQYDIATQGRTPVKDLGATATDLVVMGDAIFALCGDNNNGWYSTDGTEWKDMAVTGTVMMWWLDNAWRARGNTLYSSPTPKESGTWSSGQKIGDAAYDITSLAAYDSKVYIGKEEGLFYYDGTSVAEAKDCRQRIYSGNFKGMASWAGYLYFQVMSTVMQYHPTSEKEITPRFVGGRDEEFYGFGIPKFFLPSQKGIYVLFEDAKGSTPYVLKYNGLGWQVSWVGTATLAAHGLGWSGLANWLLVSEQSNTSHQLRRTLADAPYDDYEASGYFLTPHWDGGFPEEYMEVRLCTISGQDLDSTEKITVYYQDDRDGEWTKLGEFIKTPQQMMSFSPLKAAIPCRELYLKVVLERDTGDTSKTPRLEGWSVQFKNRPSPVYMYSPVLKLGDKLERKDTVGDLPYTFLDQLMFLERCAGAVEPLVYNTPLGQRVLVDMTNSQGGQGTMMEDGRTYQLLSVNFIEAYPGEWVTVAEGIEFGEEISITIQTAETKYFGEEYFGVFMFA